MANKTCSINDILGKASKRVIPDVPTTDCVVCNKPLPAIRIEALKSLNLPKTRWAHVGCSTVTKTKGIYLGEAGTSHLQLCTKVYNDSVRSVFKSSASGDDEDES